MLADLMIELGGPGLFRPIRRWAKGHARETEIIALCDEVERPRREEFEGLVMDTIERGEYPSADNIQGTRDIRELTEWYRAMPPGMASFHSLNYHGLTLNQDQCRWRAELLTKLGWTQGKRNRAGVSGRWCRPKGGAK